MVPNIYSMTYELCDNRDHPLHFMAFMPLSDEDQMVVGVAGSTDGYWLEVNEDLTAELIAQAVVRNEMVAMQQEVQQPTENQPEFEYDYGGYL